MDIAVRNQPVETRVPTTLSDLRPGMVATIVAVGSATEGVTPLELRLLELGFIAGERVEVVAEARPGRDPFVVRVGAPSSRCAAARRRTSGSRIRGPRERRSAHGRPVAVAHRGTQLRQDRPLQPPHGQPPEGGELRRGHRRAQGGALRGPIGGRSSACWTCRAPTACSR